MRANASEVVAVVASIDPDAYTATTYLTDAIDASKFHRYVFIVEAGELGSSATIDLAVQGATSAAGSYTSITGASITQLTQAGTDSDKQAIVEISPEFVQGLGLGYTHLKGLLTVGTATSDVGVIVLGVWPKVGIAADFDLASVDEIVSKVTG